MAIAYSNAAAQARATAYLIATSTAAGASVDGQVSFGQLVIGTASLSGGTGVIATIALLKPSFTIVGKTSTLNGVPIAFTASAAGTAALGELRDSLGNTVVSGLTVGVGGGFMIQVNSVSYGVSEPGTVTGGTITHP
jgi:hypothetical protein